MRGAGRIETSASGWADVMKFRMERWQGALAVALLLGSLPAMAEEQPSVWPKDIYSAEENAAASENPGDKAEGAPAQTVDLTDPDIDWLIAGDAISARVAAAINANFFIGRFLK